MQPDNFNKQIREALKNKHFAYDPAAWEQATALLDQQQRKKRMFWWLWSVVGILLLGLLGAVQYNHRTGIVDEQNLSAASPLSTLQQSEDQDLPLEEDMLVQPSAWSNSKLADQPTQNPSTPVFTGTKKSLTSQNLPVAEETAAATTIEEAATERAYAHLMQPKRPSRLQRILLISSLSKKEEPEASALFERKKTTIQSVSLGFHAFGGTGLRAAEISRQFNYGGGLFIELRKNRLYLAMEPAIHLVQGINGSSIRRDTSYAFGQIIKTQNLTWNQLLLVQLPVVVGFELAPKHTLAVGMVTQQYLQSNYTLTESIARQGFPEEEPSISNGKARINGINIPPAYALIRYQYQIAPGFSLGMQYNFTALSTPTPIQSQLQFQLKYHLFNRLR